MRGQAVDPCCGGRRPAREARGLNNPGGGENQVRHRSIPKGPDHAIATPPHPCRPETATSKLEVVRSRTASGAQIGLNSPEINRILHELGQKIGLQPAHVRQFRQVWAGCWRSSTCVPISSLRDEPSPERLMSNATQRGCAYTLGAHALRACSRGKHSWHSLRTCTPGSDSGHALGARTPVALSCFEADDCR